MGLRPTTRLQLVALDDIGAFAAMAFSRPQEFVRQAIEIAGDELTMPQAAEILGSVIGRSVRFVELSLEDITRANEEWGRMLEWFNQHGYRADISALRSLHPGLMSFEQWLHHVGWEGLGLRKVA
jgi:uncharacterized protein YbjT (DUF2867 family)